MTAHGLDCVALLESKAFLSFQRSMKCFTVAELAEVRRWVTQSCVAVAKCVGIFFFFLMLGGGGTQGLCEHYSLELCEMKESGEIDSSALFRLSLSHQHTVSCSEEN